MKRWIERFLVASSALISALCMTACVANHPLPVRGDENVFAVRIQTDLFPGNYPVYSFGSFQKKENFANVEKAQSNVNPRNADRLWINIPISATASPNMGNLQSYFPFDVRWKLKDGREFMAQNIDVRGISNEYLGKYPLQLQWQRENRRRDSVGDYEPVLSFEIKDDAVLLKWVIRINRTPVNERLTSSGAATKWDVYGEEHIMAAIKGTPTSGINFNKQDEPRK